MARLYTMGSLVLRCQRRADLENSGLISGPEWKAMISESYGEMYSIVCDSGMRYFETTSTIAATGAASYTEPSGVMSYVAIDRIDSAGFRYALRPRAPQERSRYVTQTGDAAEYDLVDDQIRLWPKPSSGSYEILYVPQPPDLGVYADATSVDLVVPDGESFLIWSVLVKALAKAERDTTLAQQEREAARARFTEWAGNRFLIESRRRMVDGDDVSDLRTAWSDF